MRVILTHPYCWPHVRRGTERNMEIVASYLASRGHDVTLVSTAPGQNAEERAGGTLRILRRPLWAAPLSLLRVGTEHSFFFTSLRALRNMQADAVHSFYYSDALAADSVRRGKGWRTVLQLNGIAIPGISCRRFPPEAWMMRRAIERTDEFIVCSRFIGDLAARYYGREPRVIAPPVDLADWPLGDGPPDGEVNILGVANFDLRRKGVRVLVRAFELLKRRMPSAVLRLTGQMSPRTAEEITAGLPDQVRKDVRILGLGQPGDVPVLYRSATITALPAMWEPSAGSLLESLASGTPVVAANHGGMPEFLTPDTGALFDPLTEAEETTNAAGLCEAMEAGIELAARPGVRARCRARAEQFSTLMQGPTLERLYAGTL